VIGLAKKKPGPMEEGRACRRFGNASTQTATAVGEFQAAGEFYALLPDCVILVCNCSCSQSVIYEQVKRYFRGRIKLVNSLAAHYPGTRPKSHSSRLPGVLLA
jgi:hypothetical protein